jgi:hypothetical protein
MRLAGHVLAALSVVAGLPAQLDGKAVAIDGRVAAGVLRLDGDAIVVDTAAGLVRWQLAELAEFQVAGATPRPVSALHRVWLRSGAELPATRLALLPGPTTRLAATLPCGAVLELPLAMLRAVRQAGAERPEPQLFAADLAEPPANQDLLYVVRDGKAQRSSVRITGATDTQLAFELRDRQYEFAFDGVAALVFGANTGFAPDRLPKPRTVVALSSGEAVEGKLLGLGERLRLQLDEGAVLDVPATELLRLTVASDRRIWLGDLVPEVEQTPAFDRVWPWTVDRTVAGPGFVLGGRTFARGVGMVPRTRLTYTLQARYDAFEATIGIDDRAGPAGAAVFRVLVDDQVVSTVALARSDAPRPIAVELGGARKLAIEVDFGPGFDVGDLCAFADARVIQR